MDLNFKYMVIKLLCMGGWKKRRNELLCDCMCVFMCVCKYMLSVIVCAPEYMVV